MATQTDVLQAGVDADQFLVGPSVLLYQSTTNYSNSGDAANGMPRGIEDIIDVTTGVAMTANGWTYLGYTENAAMSRNRTIVHLDSDQEARVKTVHDLWENTITVTALETTLDNLTLFLQGTNSAVVAGPPAQHAIYLGNSADIDYRRVAIIHVEDSGKAWAYVWRKCNMRPTGGPTFTRTGRVEWPLEINAYPDTRVSTVTQRVARIFQTDATIET